MNITKIVLFNSLICLSILTYAQEKKLVLATTSWCPYTCDNNNSGNGIIGQYVIDLLVEHGYEVSIEHYPWSRAISLANSNVVDGLLTAVAEEAPLLTLTNTPISNYQVCFFTDRNSDWKYQQPLALNQKRLGVIKDYSYGEPLDSFIKATLTQPNLISLYGDSNTERLLRMLLGKRVDIIAEDQTVLFWQATLNNISLENIKNVGCLEKNPFYLAISPKYEYHDDLLRLLDGLFALEKNKILLKKRFNKLSY